MKQKFINLSWQMLEHKYRYYVQNKPVLSDFEFDALEARYRDLAEKLQLPPTASDMVDFDWSRPACQRAAFKVHALNPDKGEYRLGASGEVYKRGRKGNIKVRG